MAEEYKESSAPLNQQEHPDQQGEEKKKYAEKKIKHHESMKSRRSLWESNWQECMDYIVPRKNDVTTKKSDGDKRGNDLFDTTAIHANQLLAAALHSMLTNPQTRFFDLIFGDPTLDENDDVKEWLQEVAHRMYTVLNNTNFQTEVHEIYIDLGAIGTSCLYMGEHDENIVHFAARAMKEVFIEENNLGLIDTVNREFDWTWKQIVQEFGEENLPKWIINKYNSSDDAKQCILHSVSPSEEKGGRFPIKSCYILKDQKYILSEGGFREFPYAVPRWTKTSGEIYGRGPGMDMLPDVKMVNKMMETTLKGAQKTVDPPLMVMDDGVIGKVRLTPGGLTVMRPGSDPIKPLITDGRIDFGYQAVEDVRKRIRAGFYVDQILMNQGPQKTATEVSQIVEEQSRFMGPILGRQHFEFLRPVIERVFGLMDRRGLLPPAPQEIQGKKFDVRYSSLIARVQRMSEGQNLTRAISVAAPLINAAPESLDNVDSDKALKYVFDIYGVPQKVMRNPREIQKIREGRAQAQQQAVEQAQQSHQAEVASKVMPGMAQMQQAQNKQGG